MTEDAKYPPALPLPGGVMRDPVPQYGLTAADKIARVKTLGASEIAAVAGLSQYRNALDIFLAKTSKAPIVVENEELAEYSEWGHRLEPMIAQKYSDVHGVSLILGERTVHETETWMSATPDRLVLRNWGDTFTSPDQIDRGLELKNRNAHVADQFGEIGSDIIPQDIAAQCYWSLGVFTHLDVWDLAVLIGGNKWGWYRVHRDNEIIAALQERGYDFWHNYVLKNREPAIDGSESWKQYIHKKFAKHTEVMREGEPSDYVVFTDLVNVKSELKSLEEQRTQLETMLKAQVADAAGIAWPNGAKFTWKLTKDSTGVDYQAVAFELAATHNVPLDEQRALAEKHTIVTRAGVRKVHISLPKEKK